MTIVNYQKTSLIKNLTSDQGEVYHLALHPVLTHGSEIVGLSELWQSSSLTIDSTDWISLRQTTWRVLIPFPQSGVHCVNKIVTLNKMSTKL